MNEKDSAYVKNNENNWFIEILVAWFLVMRYLGAGGRVECEQEPNLELNFPFELMTFDKIPHAFPFRQISSQL